MYPLEYIIYRRSYSHAPILVNSYERVLLQAGEEGGLEEGNRRLLSDVLARIADGMTE